MFLVIKDSKKELPKNLPSSTTSFKELKERLTSPIVDQTDSETSNGLLMKNVVNTLTTRTEESLHRKTMEPSSKRSTVESPFHRNNSSMKQSLYYHEKRESPMKMRIADSITGTSKSSFVTPLKHRTPTKEISPTTPATILPIPIDHSTVLPNNAANQNMPHKKRRSQENSNSDKKSSVKKEQLMKSLQNNLLSKQSTNVINIPEQIRDNRKFKEHPEEFNQRHQSSGTNPEQRNRKFQERNKKLSSSTTSTTESVQVVPQKKKLTSHQLPHTTAKSPKRHYPVVMTTRLSRKAQVNTISTDLGFHM